jgi:CRP-like cAMP-binding protein
VTRAPSSFHVSRYPRLLDKLEAHDRDWLRSRATTVELVRGALVFSQSEPIDDVFIIESGRVKAYYTTPQGQSITFAFWLEGMLMGVPGVSTGFDHMWTAEVIVPTRLMRFARTDLLAVVDRSITAAKSIIEILEFKSKYLSRLAQLLGTASVADRLRFVLYSLRDLYGVPDPETGGVRIELPLTHADIADMVGASRQWVTVSLGQLERDGLICTRQRYIIVAEERDARRSALVSHAG